jgi:hypothetical protein
MSFKFNNITMLNNNNFLNYNYKLLNIKSIGFNTLFIAYCLGAKGHLVDSVVLG